MFRRKPFEIRVTLYDDNEVSLLKLKLDQALQELDRVKAELKQARRDCDRMAIENISLLNRLDDRGVCNTDQRS